MTTVVAVLLLTGETSAQPPPSVRSPEVHADRRVTFRVRAPEASRVDLVGEVLQGQGPQAMTKGPAFYDARAVPHGEFRMVLYESKAMGVNRYVWVYTPPNYDTSTARYPVYYLLHGIGETQSGWVMNGRANIILDNPIAGGTAEPMVVVMPHAHPIQSASVGPFAQVPADGEPSMFHFTLFTRELLGQIIPFVERNFRVYSDADHRAIGGLSMGAFQSIAIGLAHPELFSYVLAYSGGFGALGPLPPVASVETQSPWKELLANPAPPSKTLKLLFLGAGQRETGMLAPGRRLVSAPLLFKPRPGSTTP